MVDTIVNVRENESDYFCSAKGVKNFFHDWKLYVSRLPMASCEIWFHDLPRPTGRPVRYHVHLLTLLRSHTPSTLSRHQIPIYLLPESIPGTWSKKSLLNPKYLLPLSSNIKWPWVLLIETKVISSPDLFFLYSVFLVLVTTLKGPHSAPVSNTSHHYVCSFGSF